MTQQKFAMKLAQNTKERKDHVFKYRPNPIRIGNFVSDFEVPDTIWTV